MFPRKTKRQIGITSFALHIIAMIAMLLDHLWGTLISGNDWMTCIGRIAFPIFSFMLVEGFFHTHNLKKYTLRLLLFAIISEIPFDLMLNGATFYPFHQNVMWTFLIAIAVMYCNEKVKEYKVLKIIVAFFSIFISFIIGTISMVDYGGYGILMVLTFYFFHQKKWWSYIAQFLVLFGINYLMAGFEYQISIPHIISLTIPRQLLALISLLPIWVYNGKQGYHKKWFQYTCYAFYPLHLLLLGLIAKFS